MIMIDGIEMNTAANYILSQNIPVLKCTINNEEEL